jgi:GNAT superfamily N-acetyltransferase
MPALSANKEIRIESLFESNVDDLINVCSSGRLDDPVHKQGISFKRKWLMHMLSQWGPCAKIAYYEQKPVAQILYHPEEAEVAKTHKRTGVLVLDCIYNPVPAAQKLGIGTKLLESVIKDARQGRSCLGNRKCKFIIAKAFNTGEFLPLPNFYAKKGFLSTPDGKQLWLSLDSDYEPAMPIGDYEPLSEDKNRALIFYSPTCQFSYQFAKREEEVIRQIAPDMQTELINEWEKPEEAIKRKNLQLVVNAKAIHTFFMETEKFKHEIGQAIS